MAERDLTLWSSDKLSVIAARGGLRRCTPYSTDRDDPVRLTADGRKLINFGSNDYLGLSHAPQVQAAARAGLDASGSGVGASRVLAGTRPEHEALEGELASWLGKEAALLFGAGYLANLGVMSALLGRHDLVLADRLVHASILDGITLSGAKLARFKHNRLDDLDRQLRGAAAKRVFIVTESVFSMDGDIAPVSDILDLGARHGAGVIIDEAHALGVFGESGEGVLTAEDRARVAVITGTLSKACGSYGGFAVCAAPVRQLLQSSARSFLFNTGLPAHCAAAALQAIELIRGGASDRRSILTHANRLRRRLREIGFEVGASLSQIIPVHIGSTDAVMTLAEALAREGFLVPAIRPPTVPPGTERLRISLTSAHTEEHTEDLLRALQRFRASK